MAFTRVRGPGITTDDNYRVGILTATKFVGPMQASGDSDFTNISATGIGTIDGVKIGDPSGIVTASSSSGIVTYYGDASKLTGLTAGQIPNLAASKITSGTVATARLGSGTANNSSFLRGDQSWAAVTSTTINNNANDRIITGSGTANTLEGESALTFDSNGLKIHGTKKLYFGDSGTFQMNFSTHTFIEHTSASGTFYIQGDTLRITNKDRDETYIECDDEAGVKLKYANTTRCETTSTGVTVTGALTATSFTGTLNTAAQTNITSVGTLTGLVIDNNTNTSMSSGSAGQLQVGGDGYTGAIALDADAMHIYHNSASRALVFGTNETERLRIASDGNVTIGNDGDSGSGPSAGYDELVIEGGNENIGMCFLSPAANNVTQQISFGDSNNNQSGRIIYNHASDYMSLGVGGGADNERLRIASSGQILIGETSTSGMSANDLGMKNGAAIRFRNAAGNAWINTVGLDNSNNLKLGWGGATTEIHFGISGIGEQMKLRSTGDLIIGNGGTNSGNATVQSFSAHGNTAGESGFKSFDTTSVAAGVGGEITFAGKFNTGAQDYAYLGHIRGIKENATAGNTACALTFHTRPTLTAPQERLRITSDGRVVVTCNGNQRGLELNIGSGAGSLVFDRNGYITSFIRASDGGSNVGGGSGGGSRMRLGKTQIHFDTFPYVTNVGDAVTYTERMRIDSSGRVIINRAGNDFALESNDAAMHINTPSDGGQGGLYVRCRGQSAGTASPHYGVKIDAINCANNANLQAGLLIDLNQQYTQSGTGIQSDVYGSYNTTKCFDGILRKQVGAFTNGYTYFSNIIETSSGGASYHFRGEDNGTQKIRIERDGDIDNTNNSYGSLSDVKLKQNIVDANSQWDDIKAVKVRNFNFTAASGLETHKQIGVVAQELETVSAGLVHTDNDITLDEATGEGTVTGTTKSVKYSVLYMKAIKALQEAMIKIETLEAKVAALESS